MKRISIVLTLLAVSGPASGQAPHGEHSPYAGEESRAVNSLSHEDIAECPRITTDRSCQPEAREDFVG